MENIKNIITRLLLLFLLTQLLSCQGNTLAHKVNYRITVIFKAVPTYDSIKTPSGIHLVNRAEINYLSNFFQENQQPMDYKGKNDTVSLECLENNLVLAVRYYNSEWIYYSLQRGDTAIFSFKNNFPFCNISNRACSSFDNNYQYFKRMRFHQLAPQGQYYNMIMRTNSNPEKYIKERYSDLVNQNYYIDSLLKENLLSKEYAEFHRANSRYSFLSMPHVSIALQKQLLQEETIDLKNDSLLNNRNYLFYLKNFISRNYNKLSGDKSDPCIAFDSIQKSNLFSDRVKIFLLTNSFSKICENGSIDDIQNYYNKYKTSVTDSAINNFLIKRYSISEIRAKNLCNDLLLASSHGEKTTLNDILLKLKGNVVVIDFWASWCSPCRQQMPFNRQLEEKFKSSKVTFIYLSIDRDRSLWLKACAEEKITDNYLSFLVLPSRSSYIENIGLKSIPRSIIYNKEGILVCKEAPRPDSQLLTDMINKYLK